MRLLKKIKFSYKSKKKFNYKKLKARIIKCICDKNTLYVSFDIFDTLLIRPCIYPKDIFSILATKFDKQFDIDFFNVRTSAEREIKNKNAALKDIYQYIKCKYNFSDEIINILMKEEIALETQLLSVRNDVKEFYDLAIKNNKKIIAVSDMYLPSKVLQEILSKKGFDKIEKVYVSNEYSARKDDGELFKIIISELKTQSICHIGDNYNSDFIIPNSIGKIVGCYYPSIIDFLKSANFYFYRIINNISCKNVAEANRNLFLGYVFNNYWFALDKNNIYGIFNNIVDFCNLFLGPYLYFINFQILRNNLIQNNYKKIFFVSRDGYLPYIVYNKLKTTK